MGGPGSGNRWHYGAKSTTDDYRTLDVRRWAREGVLRPGYCSGWQWTRDGERRAMEGRRPRREARDSPEGALSHCVSLRTFERLAAKHDDLVGRSMEAMMLRFRLMGRSPEKAE